MSFRGHSSVAEWELPKLQMRVRFPLPARFLSVALLLTTAWAGCATYPEAGGPDAPESGRRIHRVERGETLWSISKRYSVRLEDLTRENRISDRSRLEVGQRLTIPNGGAGVRDRALPVSSLPDNRPVRVGAEEEFTWPVQGRVISIFGTRRRGRVNKGIDIQAPSGAEVRAARSGRVSFVHEGLPGFGKTIIVEHAGGFASVYAFVEEILVRPGEQVAQRQVIARVGETGRAELPALHFEIRRAQRAQNPLHYLP